MIWTHAAAALVAAALAFAGGWRVRDWAADAAELRRVRSEQRDTLRRQEAATGAGDRLELTRERIRTQIQTVTVEVPRVVERPVYRAECWDADGLRLLARAIGTAGDPAQPDAPLPASAPAH